MSKIFFMCGTIVDVDFETGLEFTSEGYGFYPGKTEERTMMRMLESVLGHDEIGILAYPAYEEWRHSKGESLPEHTVMERMKPHDPFTGDPMF